MIETIAIVPGRPVAAAAVTILWAAAIVWWLWRIRRYLRRRYLLDQMHRRINAAEAVHGPAVDRILDARDRLEVMAEERRNSPAIRQYRKRRAAALKATRR